MESINGLPHHLVSLILQQLPIEDRCRCCAVNRSLNALNFQQQLGPVLTLRPQQVADPSFLCWARGRMSGVTALHVLPCQSARDRVAQFNLTTGLIMLLGMCEQRLKELHVPDTISLNQAVLRHLPCGLEIARLAVAFNDACADQWDGETYAFPAYMPALKHLRLQIICTHLQSYGLVSMPAGLPASLETLCVGTKARGRRIGPSLLMPEAPQLSNVKELELDATCFICHEGDASLAAFLGALPQLQSVKLRSDLRAVDYQSALTRLPDLKCKHWEAI